MQFSLDKSAVETAFANNFKQHNELGASFALWQDGVEVISLAGGYQDRDSTVPWTSQTRFLWWSATKTPAAVTTLLALNNAAIDLHSPVSQLWPEFGANGKDHVTFLELFSHQAGLAGIPEQTLDPYDHAAVAAALAAMPPLWQPGSAHGYHARTYGYLLDEIVRRLSSQSLGSYWQQQIAAPAAIDFHIGLSAENAAQVADSFAPDSTSVAPEQQAFYSALSDPQSLASLAFRSPGGDIRPRLMNSIAARSYGFPAMGGIGTASGLAKFYAILANHGELNGTRFLPAEICDQLNTPLCHGNDLVLRLPTSFSCGAMLDPIADNGSKHRKLFGPLPSAFGHPGAGGTLAFADPENGLAFAYGMNRMIPGLLPGPKALALVAASYSKISP